MHGCAGTNTTDFPQTSLSGAQSCYLPGCLQYAYNTDTLFYGARGILVTRTTAVEFQRKFGDFQHEARREPVEITRHGRRELVLMSADHYDWLVGAARRSHRTTEAAAVVVDAVRRAEMDPEHGPLDDLLK